MLIPYAFIQDQSNLSWQDALWGVNNQMMELRETVNLAKNRVFAGSDDRRETELAWLDPSYTYRADELVRELAASEEAVDETLIQKKWLYLTLSWMFEHRTEIDDPLTEVESVYANFDYPEEIENFVRYMPPTDGVDPKSYSKEENEQRMMEKWRWYLDQARTKFGKKPSAD